MARQYYKDSTTGQMKPIGVKVEDTLPVGTIVEYNGQNIPEGWTDIGNGKIEKEYQVIPTNALLENGDSTSATNGYTAEYINNHSVVVSPTEPSGSARKKVWMQKGKNLISADNIIAGIYGISSGAYSSSDSARCTKNMIEIDNTKNYVLSTGSSSSSVYMYVMFYNASGTYLGYTGGTLNNPIVLNTYSNYSNAKFINLRFDTTYIPEMMLEEGNTKTTYEDYTAKTYTLDGTIYRPFISQNEVYSSNEVKIGTWINGKPLYRKVINFGTLPNATNKSVPTNIANIDKTIKLYGYAVSGNTTIPIPHANVNPISVNFYKNSSSENGVLIQTTIDRSGYTECYITVEYTKTTDD